MWKGFVFMKLLVLTESYPRPNGVVFSQYVHSRNLWYKQEGIEVVVLCFDAKANYEIDGIQVISMQSYVADYAGEPFDLLVLHAPNIRNHYQFLKKHGERFPKFVFFFHGHEVLKSKEVYPEPFPFAKKFHFRQWVKNVVYDDIKLLLWRKFIPKIVHKSHFVFVSEWMYDMFLKYVRINPQLLTDKMSIIYNCVGKVFEEKQYDSDGPKQFDFITIRNNLDGAKYGIDIVTEVARQHPQYHFCVIGEGEFFTHVKRPENMTWMDKSLRHDEIIAQLNQARIALLPTRTDAQGVMACEMATYGIPLITSNIPVCREVFAGFSHVYLFNHDEASIDFTKIVQALDARKDTGKNEKYFAKNTIQKEIELFNQLIETDETEI